MYTSLVSVRSHVSVCVVHAIYFIWYYLLINYQFWPNGAYLLPSLYYGSPPTYVVTNNCLFNPGCVHTKAWAIVLCLGLSH